VGGGLEAGWDRPLILMREGEGAPSGGYIYHVAIRCSPGDSRRVYKTADYPDHVMVIVALARYTASDVFHVTAMPSLR